MGKKRYFWKKATAWLLSASMVSGLGTPAYGYISPKTDYITVEGNDQQGITEDESWKEEFPNGTFAFQNSYQYIYEGKDEEEKITVYRLGGTEGKAIAHIAVTPAVAETEDGELNTVYAASWQDFTIQVENPVEEEEDQDQVATASNSSANNQRSRKKNPGFTQVDTSGEDEFATIFLDLEFADGEYVKELRVKANDDDEAETMEFALFTIADATGAEFTETANCLTLGIYDDEETVESELGFAVTKIRADKSAGKAVLTVRRTKGIQYVAECSFRTADGTAEAGVDYQKTEGTVSFTGGQEEAEITIELVDDGILTEDPEEEGSEEEEPYFEVQLFNPKAAYLIDGEDTATVSLYNSGNGDDVNLATLLYTPDAVDLSGQIEVGEPLVQAGEAAEIEATTQEPEYIEAEYTPIIGPYNPYLRKSTNLGELVIESGGGWRDTFDMCGPEKENTITAEDWVTDFSGKGTAYYVGDKSENWEVDTNYLASTSLSIDRLYERYSKLYYMVTLETDKAGGAMKHRNVAYVYVGRKKDAHGNILDKDGAGAAKEYREWLQQKAFYNLSNPGAKGTLTDNMNDDNHFAVILCSLSGENNENRVDKAVDLTKIRKKAVDQGKYTTLATHYNKINGMIESQDKSRPIHGQIYIHYLALERAHFVKNPLVVVHVADDSLTEKEVKAIAPSISINTSNGGVYANESNGKRTLFVGSQLRFETKNKGSYNLASQPSLRDTAGNVINTANNGILSLQHKNSKEGFVDGSKEYTIDIVLDRVQNVNLNYNAVMSAKIQDETDEEKSARITKTLNKLKTNLASAVYTYKQEDATADSRFSEKTENGGFVQDSNSETFSLKNVKNLQSINFKMDAADIIAYGGQYYRGNETISIHTDDFSNPDLNFDFVDSTVVAAEFPMAITGINKIEVYIDKNNDGSVDEGSEPEATLNKDQYMIADFEPVEVSKGVYCQRLLLIDYNMTPKTYGVVPVGAKDDDKCEVIPNLVSAVTNLGAKEKLSSQMKEYRPLRTVDGDQRMYGQGATKGSVTIPLGGDMAPPSWSAEDNGYKWEPQWFGSLREDYQMGTPEDIVLDGTVVGDEFIAASAAEPEAVKGYLGSLHGDDSITMTFQYEKNEATVIDSTNPIPLTVIPTKAPAPMNLDQTDPAAADTEGRSSDLPNLTNTEPKMDLPKMNVPLGPLSFVSGNGMLGFTLGTDVFGTGTDKNGKVGGTGSGQTRDNYTQNDRVINELQRVQSQASEQQKTILQVLRERRGQSNGDDSAVSGGSMMPSAQTNRSTDIHLAVSISFLWKYSTITNNYEFYSAGFFMNMGGSQRVTIRLDVCPIFYAYVTFGAELGLATGLNVEEYLDDNDKRQTRVKWAGATIDAELFIEVGAGVGIELVSAEIFVKGTVGVQFALTAEPNFKVNRFVTRAAIGYRIVLLFFTHEMEALAIEAGYDVNKDGNWYWEWYALGKKQGGSTRSRSIGNSEDSEFGSPGLRIKLPDNTYYEEAVYSPEDNMPSPVQTRAFDVDGTPFQVSGYASSVSGAKLADGMNLGSKYQLVSAGNEHYVLYLASRKPEGQLSTADELNATALMLSKLKMTSENGTDQSALGLVHPFKEDDPELAVMVDSDVYGDLDFSGQVYDGKLHVTWTTYTEAMEDVVKQFEDAQSQEAAMLMSGLSSTTAVKTRVFDLTDGAGTTAVMASPSNAEDAREYKYLPQPAGEKAAVFARSHKYTDQELEAINEELKAHYAQKEEAEGKYPYAQSEYQYKLSMAAAYGKGASIGISIKNADGSTNEYKIPLAGSKATQSNAAKVTQLVSRTEEAGAATTIQMAYVVEEEGFNEKDELLTAKKLFLQTVTIEDNKVTPGSPILIEKLAEAESDGEVTGEYGSNGEKLEGRDGVYLAGLKFLNGKIQSKTSEDFFLYNKSGTTYYINEASLEGLSQGDSSRLNIKPVFDPEDSASGSRNDVTIGADPEGNLTAVYTDTVENTANNALCMTKYDPGINEWSDVIMLAMNRMQVYEDSKEQGWDKETTIEQYYLRDINGRLDKFVFSGPQIATGVGDKLVILANGVHTPLSVLYYGLDSEGNYLVKENGEIDVTTSKDEEHPYMQALQDPDKNSTSGVYALAYGVGQRLIGDPRISFVRNAFIPNETLLPTVSFRNAGDVAIRGSADNPIKVRLKLTGDGGDGADVELASWDIKGNIRAGETITTADAGDPNRQTVPLPDNLGGRKIYFTVEEDSSYIKEGAFSYSSLPSDGKGGMAIEITQQPELVLENVRTRAEGHSNVQVRRSGEKMVEVELDMDIRNAGTIAANDITVTMEYSNSQNEDGVREYKPVEETIQTAENCAYTLEGTTEPGTFKLKKKEGYHHLNPQDKAAISGIIALPASYYDTSGTYRAMNLRFTVAAAEEEYDSTNNISYQILQAFSTFDVPARISLMEKTPIQISVPVDTADGVRPEIMVTELAADGKNKLLSTASYNPVSQILTLVPKESSGSGIVRIADMATSSYKEIAFTITGEGVNINLDNTLLTFKGQGWQDIRYPDKEGIKPYLGDLAHAKKGDSFTFETYATKIHLYFEGNANVTSTLPGFAEIPVKGNGYGISKSIDFLNKELKKHKVTITLTSEEGEFDRYIEDYAKENPWQDDTRKPEILLGKSLPEEGSLKKGETFTLPVFIVDDYTLSGVYIGGNSVVYETGSFARGQLDITENGSYQILAYDGNGNKAEQTLEVKWFAESGGLTADMWPEIKDFYLTDEDGNRLEGEPVKPKLAADISAFITDGNIYKDWSMEESGVIIDTEKESDRIITKEILENPGYYLAEVKNQTYKSCWLTYVDEVIVKGPDLVLMDSINDNEKMFYSAGKETGGIPIQTVKVYAGADATGKKCVDKDFGSASQTKYVSGTFDKLNVAAYFIEAVDIRGNKSQYMYSNYAVLTDMSLDAHDDLLNFESHKTDYTVILPYGTTKIPQVSAEASKECEVTVKQAESLTEAGKNEATVMVSQVKEKETVKKTYKITFVVEQCRCDITELNFNDDTLSIPWDKENMTLELNATGYAGDCTVPGHKDDEIQYSYTLLEGEEQFDLKGNLLTAKDSGTARVEVEASKNGGKTLTRTASITAVKQVRIAVKVREMDQNRGAGMAYIADNDYLDSVIVDKGTEVTISTCGVFDESQEGYEEDMKRSASVGYAFARWQGVDSQSNEYSFTANENAEFTAEFLDITSPEGEVKIADSTWKEFLNTITFGLFFQESQVLTVNATDNDKTKEPEVSYHISKTAQTLDEIEAQPESYWTAYTKAVSLDPDLKAVAYVRIKDQDGNATYLSSDGVIVDATAPLVVLPEDMEDFSSEPVEVLVQTSDTLAGIEKVTYETDEKTGKQAGTVELQSGQGTVTLVNDGDYTVTVTSKDRAGNKSQNTMRVLIDKTVPDITVRDLSDEWVNHPVELELTKGDVGVSGVTLWVSKDGGAKRRIADSGVYEVKENGLYEFTIETGAGVKAHDTIRITRIDPNKPVIAVTGMPEGKNVPYVITMAAADDMSGVEEVWYTEQGSTVKHPVEMENGTGKITVYRKVKDVITIWAKDRAGNVSSIDQEVDLSVSTGSSGGSGTSGGSSGGSGGSPSGTKKQPLLKKLYLPNGQAAYNTWVMADGKWYYAGNDGMAVTGWLKDPKDGYWYFLNADGSMAVGWVLWNGSWYYLNPTAPVQSGWVINETTGILEYVPGNNGMPLGAMYTQTVTPDGYPVDASGKWIQ